jgi:nucleotide-binding universal stress UspA family protein
VLTKLLVGLDGSLLAETVLPHAVALARQGNLPLVLIRVISLPSRPGPAQENPQLLPYMVVMPEAESLAEENEEVRRERYEARNYLDDIAQKLEQRDVVVETAVVRGHPATVLVEEAKARGASLILLGTHGRSGLGRLIYGSVAEQVVASSPVPVLLARAWRVDPSARLGPRCRILVPLDSSAAAETALAPAADLARLLGAELYLLEVVPEPWDTIRAVDSWLGNAATEALGDEEAEASTYLVGVAAKLREQGLAVKTATRANHVAAGIVRAAEESGAALVVMATHGHASVGQVLPGSVASEVLHGVKLPLLLVGPAVRT